MGLNDRAVDLVKRSLVEVHGAKRGTGFFVAPNLAISCAHVTGDAGTTVQVRTSVGQTKGTVLAASEGALSMSRFPDLAVIHVDKPSPEHPCLWLDDETPELGSDVFVAGHSELLKAGLRFRAGRMRLVGRDDDDDGSYWTLEGTGVPVGMSGGPVVSLTTGGVVAVMKFSWGGDRGGGAVPIRATRLLDPDVHVRVVQEHDAFHANDARWASVAETFQGPDTNHRVTHRERLNLYRLLAALPKARRPLLADLEDSAPLLPQAEHHFHTYRDVAADLHDLVAPQAGPPLVLSYAVTLARRYARHPAGDAVRDWTLITGGRIGQSEAVLRSLRNRATRSPTAALMVQFQDTPDRDLFTLSMWRFPSLSDPIPVGHYPDPMSIDQARPVVESYLPAQIALLEADHREVIVEFILPAELLGVAVESWTPWRGRRARSPLGRKYAVVVRDLDRLHDPQMEGAWRRRWDAVQYLAADVALEWVSCGMATDFDALEGWLEHRPNRGALAFNGGPSVHATVDAGLACGVAVMFWRREACRPCALSVECDGFKAFDHLRRELSGRPLPHLPEALRRLRADAARPDAEATHCGRDVVLLWDDPDRRPPRSTLRVPGPASPSANDNMRGKAKV